MFPTLSLYMVVMLFAAGVGLGVSALAGLLIDRHLRRDPAYAWHVDLRGVDVQF